MKIKFKCPKCGSNEIEEIIIDVTVNSIVANDRCSFVNGELDLDYDEQINDGGELRQYQCGGCGKVICKTISELFEYLKSQNMIEFEEGETFDNGVNK